MSNTIYIESNGLAANEQIDLDTLSGYAKNGWILERPQFTGYQLKKGEPQNLIYSIAIEEEPEKEYFKMFEESGWTHVYSNNHMHFFKAPAGTTPIYTDKEGLIEKYKTEKNKSLKYSMRIIYVILLTFLIGSFTYIGWIPSLFGGISMLVGYFAVIALIFTLLPYLEYKKKYKNAIEGNSHMIN